MASGGHLLDWGEKKMRCVLPLLMASALPAGVVYAEQAIPIFDYIRQTWKDLTRSHRNLAAAAVDLKFPAPADGHWPVYVPASENLSSVQAQLRADMAPTE